MNIIIGLVVALGRLIGSFMASGGHLNVLGAGLGAFMAGHPVRMAKDSGAALVEAVKYNVPRERQYLDTLGVLY